MSKINIDRVYTSVKSGEREKPAEKSTPLMRGSALRIVTDEPPRLIKKDQLKK